MEITFDKITLPTFSSLESEPAIGSGGEGGKSFLSYLEKSVSDVNQMLNQADQKATELAVGKSENLHEAMIAAEKAETAFKLMTQFRAKAIEAYNEIMRMQV